MQQILGDLKFIQFVGGEELRKKEHNMMNTKSDTGHEAPASFAL